MPLNNQKLKTELSIPAIPNAPLASPLILTKFGDLQLKKNVALNLYINSKHDLSISVFDKSYQNNQSFSLEFNKHLNEILLLFKRIYPKNTYFVDVGCGKGDFLNLLTSDDYFDAIGFDTTYEGDNNKIFKRYLSDSDRIQADVVILRHVLEYIPSPYNFLETLNKVFGNVDIYIEQPNFDLTIQNQNYHDITYERVNYFTKASLNNLFTKTISGRLFNDQYQYVISNLGMLNNIFKDEFEKNCNWNEIDYYTLFSELPNKIGKLLLLIENSNNTFIWGASTKGCMFLFHYLEYLQKNKKNNNKIKFAIDINPGKFNKFIPGSYLQIKSAEYFLKTVSDNDLVIISNENYEHEIITYVISKSNKNIKFTCL